MVQSAELPADLVQLGWDLRVVLGRVVRRLRQGHAAGDPTLSEISVLSRLDRQGPATPGVLAEEERVRPQAMGATLACLEQRNLVERRPHAEDGRRVVMSVTDAGRQMLLERRAVNAGRLTQALSEGFSPAEQRRLAEVVPLLERLAGLL